MIAVLGPHRSEPGLIGIAPSVRIEAPVRIRGPERPVPAPAARFPQADPGEPSSHGPRQVATGRRLTANDHSTMRS